MWSNYILSSLLWGGRSKKSLRDNCLLILFSTYFFSGWVYSNITFLLNFSWQNSRCLTVIGSNVDNVTLKLGATIINFKINKTSRFQSKMTLEEELWKHFKTIKTLWGKEKMIILNKEYTEEKRDLEGG